MRCSICNFSYNIGRDGLCRVCRDEISRAKRGIVITDKETADKVETAEHRSMHFIDTSKADRYTGEVNVWKD